MNTRRYVEPEITDARIARQWAGTQERIATASRSRWQWPVLAVSVASAAIVLVVFLRTRGAAPLTVGALVESVGAQTITLSDGSRVDLAPSSSLRVGALEPQRIELALEKGSATFDVRHLETRRFAVRVGAFDVIDQGTHFQVLLAADGVIAVSVDQGTVRIVRRDSAEPARFLSAGERWSTSSADTVESALDAGVSIPGPPPLVTTMTDAGAEVPTSSSHALLPSAKELLEAAQRAQREGRLHDAATAYDRLRREYRSDSRAGLAAFELGRLRLGPLSDPHGAVQAFQDAIVLAPAAPFREDADARLVDALDADGDLKRCEAARATYLARYPSGLHASSVSSRCTPAP